MAASHFANSKSDGSKKIQLLKTHSSPTKPVSSNAVRFRGEKRICRTV